MFSKRHSEPERYATHRIVKQAPSPHDDGEVKLSKLALFERSWPFIQSAKETWLNIKTAVLGEERGRQSLRDSIRQKFHRSPPRRRVFATYDGNDSTEVGTDSEAEYCYFDDYKKPMITSKRIRNQRWPPPSIKSHMSDRCSTSSTRGLFSSSSRDDQSLTLSEGDAELLGEISNPAVIDRMLADNDLSMPPKTKTASLLSPTWKSSR